MGVFKKGDVIDYTLLQKKGLLPKAKEVKSPYKVQAGNIVDLTPNAEVQQTAPSTSDFASSNPFGFMDMSAVASSAQSTSTNADNSNLSAMQIKIEDLEYKLERFLEKLSLIESKLSDFERKVGS